MSNYFSDRERGPRAARPADDSSDWASIAALVEALASFGVFGTSVPQECPAGHAIRGIDTDMQKSAIGVHIERLQSLLSYP